MLTQDPPLQRRYRKFVDGAFSPKSLRVLEPFIEKTSHDLIDQFIGAGKCEFLSEFGAPDLPVLLANTNGDQTEYRLDELLPHPFELPE